MVNKINNTVPYYNGYGLGTLQNPLTEETDWDSLTKNVNNPMYNLFSTWYTPIKEKSFLDNISNFIGGVEIGPNGTRTTKGLGGTEGLANIAGALASLYSIYNAHQYNKRLDKAFGIQAKELARATQKDKDFANAINKSGLGTYSAGINI